MCFTRFAFCILNFVFVLLIIHFFCQGIIELLNKAMITMVEPEKTITPDLKPLVDHSNLWTVAKYDSDDFWFIKPCK